MSSQSILPVLTTVIVGVILVAALVGYSVFTMSSNLSSLSSQNSGLNQQLSSVNLRDSNLEQQVSSQNQQASVQNQQLTTQEEQVSSLEQQLSTVDQQISSVGQQASGLSQQVSTVEQNTMQVVTVSNTIMMVTATTSTVSVTVTSITAVPQGTLVMVTSSYDSANSTFTFKIQDTQNYTVHAQLSATVGVGHCGANGNFQAYYLSPIYTFLPLQTTTVNFPTALISSNTTCGSSLNVGQIILDFVTGNNTVVSPQYTFYYNP